MPRNQGKSIDDVPKRRKQSKMNADDCESNGSNSSFTSIAPMDSRTDDQTTCGMPVHGKITLETMPTTSCSMTLRSSISTRKRRVLTDESKPAKVQRSERILADRRVYNLRSKHAFQKVSHRSVGSSYLHKPVAVTVTPSGIVRHLNFDGVVSGRYFNHIGIEVSPPPEGVPDIFSMSNHSVKMKCKCPMHLSFNVPSHARISHLSASHINQYGPELSALLKIQECSEQLTNVYPSQMPKEKKQSVQSPPSPALPEVESETIHEDDSVVSDSDSEASSTPSTPCAGAVLKYKLQELSATSVTRNCPSDVKPLRCQPYITPKMRSILVNWLSEVALEYVVSDEALHLSISILDAVLDKGPPLGKAEIEKKREAKDCHEDESTNFVIHRSDFQALGCASLWIASKLQDKTPPSADDFVYISDYSFTADKLRKLEAVVCTQLGFRFQRVTPYLFLNNFLKASQNCPAGVYCAFDHTTLRLLTGYLLELSRLSIELTVSKPSLIAAASIYLARVTLGIRERDPKNQINENQYWSKTLAFYTGYTVSDLKDVVILIHKYQSDAERSETLKASFIKFKASQYRGVSLKTVVHFNDLGFSKEIDSCY